MAQWTDSKMHACKCHLLICLWLIFSIANIFPPEHMQMIYLSIPLSLQHTGTFRRWHLLCDSKLPCWRGWSKQLSVRPHHWITLDKVRNKAKMKDGLTSKQKSCPRMLLCTGLMSTSSSILRSRASTALLGLSNDSWDLDSFSLGIRWDLTGRKRKIKTESSECLFCYIWYWEKLVLVKAFECKVVSVLQVIRIIEVLAKCMTQEKGLWTALVWS